MTTPRTGAKPVEPSLDVGHPVQMDLDPDQNQSDPQFPSAPTTMVQIPTDGVAPGPNTQKLKVIGRLHRIAKYRIRSATIRSSGKPKRGGKAEVVRASFKRKKGIRGKRVAVKKLLWSNTADKEKISKEFFHEVGLLATLSHRNIVQLIGFVEDFKHHKAWIVLSWEPNGNVREFLKSGHWEIPERISLIKDMFDGLEYLHTLKPPIRHGDLKSLNILVSSSYEAIITDFGSARLATENVELEPTQNTVREVGRIPIPEEASSHHEVTIAASANQLTYTGPHWTLRWAAPEVVMGEKRLGLAIDIWSAAWVCWEMMTDTVPFKDVNLDPVIVGRVVTGTVPLIHEDAQLAQIIGLCSLMKDCWKFAPEKRPHVSQCLNEVRWMPSLRPLRAAPSDTKELSPRLLLEMATLRYSQDKHKIATSLLEQLLANAKSTGRQVVAPALKRLGDVYRAQCRYTEAEESYTRAQEIYARIGDDQGRANALHGLGDVHFAHCRYTEAEESYTRAQEIYARIGDDVGRANAMLGLGYVHRAQCRYTEAEESYTRAQEIYARIGHDQGRANALNGLGEVYRAQCRYTEAEESYTRAQEIFARIGHDLDRANAILGLGDVYRAKCRYTEAEESYTRAQEIYARIGYDHGRANALDGLGKVYRAQCRYTEAEESYTRAQEIYARIGHDLGRANAILGLGDVYRAKCRYTEAEESYTRAQEIYARIGNDHGRANAILGLGDVYRAKCRYTEAEESYTRAQEIYARIGHDLGRANAILGLGDVYRAKCRYTEAEESYTRAEEIYARIGNDQGRANALDRLGRVYGAQSRYTEAEEYYTRAQGFYVRIGNKLGQANTLGSLGHLRRKQARGIEAVPFYSKARELYSQIGDSRGEKSASKWLAIVVRESKPSSTSPLIP